MYARVNPASAAVVAGFALFAGWRPLPPEGLRGRFEPEGILPMRLMPFGLGRRALPADTLAQDISAFGVDLYRQLRGSGGNLIFSPYGTSAALAMALAGARGNTERQMAAALRFTLPQEALHPAFAEAGSVLAKLEGRGSIRLSTANSIWPQQGYPILERYLALVERHYETSVIPLDYRDAAEAARETVNRWVEKKTERKITDVIQPGTVDELTRLTIVNAIYFKGEWTHKFPAGQTREEPFFVSPGKAVAVPMMRDEGMFRWGEAGSVQLLEMPFRGETLSLLILLPRERDGLRRLEDALTSETLERWRKALREELVYVFVPRFRTACAFRLDRALSNMGMTDAFEAGKADFSGIDGRPGWLYVGAVLHKTYLGVNEEGAEAGAATVAVCPPAAEPGQPREFRADHPFVFAILETRSGIPLFLGRVADPAVTGE